MADASSRRCRLRTAGCSSRHPAEGSPSFDADGSRAQDAPTHSNAAHSRAEVKSAPEEVQPRVQKNRRRGEVHTRSEPRRREEVHTRSEPRRRGEVHTRSEPRGRGEVHKRSEPRRRESTRLCTPLLYPAYANIWITEGLWEEPCSPICREKRGRELPVIQIFAYSVMVFPRRKACL